MRQKTTKTDNESFTFRAKIGEYEIELNGNREEVIKTIEDLPNLMNNVHKAFETAKPKKVTTLTVKTEATTHEKAPSQPSQEYPRISHTENYDEAILRILVTDWGKWRPRTINELKEALKANGMDYPGRMLATVLMGLVKQEKIRRWNTDAGNVYILAEKEVLSLRGKTNEQS